MADDMVNVKCNATNTLILCTCHETPNKTPKDKLEKYVERTGHNPWCDVCFEIDKLWSREANEAMNEWQNKADEMKKSRNPYEALSLPQMPDIERMVSKAIAKVHYDFYHDQTKYESICEHKLKVFSSHSPPS